MAAPTFGWSETNTASVTVTDGQTNGLVFASADLNSNTASLASNYPWPSTGYTYEKWWRIKCLTVATTAISAFGVYFSATAPTDSASGTTTIPYFCTNATYHTPVNTLSPYATTLCSSATSAPGTSFTAPANTANAYSAYITQQVVTTAAAGGPTIWPGTWMTVQYSWD